MNAEGERLKRASVSLVGLHASDQDWILDRLPHTVGRKLRRYLRELEGMVGRSLVNTRGVLEELNTDQTGSHSRRISELSQQNESVSIHPTAPSEPTQILARGFREWSSEMQAAVLASNEWPWAPAYIKALPGQKRQEIERMILQLKSKLTVSVQKALSSAYLSYVKTQESSTAAQVMTE